ncbi:DUF938 domain-containing protein [Litorimonas sp. WD9-15]|uniref:DUF938 domain-containing protein n=1 Tax=Litorimonas sp. WD9-15 TaxID=3418716 RepID=UPI003D05D7CC
MTDKPIALEARIEEDGRLFSPSAGRNREVIAEHLARVLPQNAKVLEIASGTGQHGITTLVARPDLDWQFSDPNAESRESQSAWIAHSGLDLPAPLEIDTTDDWTKALSEYDAIFCANMIHIAPVEALEGLARGAAKLVKDGGAVWLYGPYLFGEDSAPSNLDFDASLKSRNCAWGVRESDFVKHIFALNGFNQSELRPMPANNYFYGFFRR